VLGSGTPVGGSSRLFRECPHPDEKQRMELSTRRCAWSHARSSSGSRNRRTQMKELRGRGCPSRCTQMKVRPWATGGMIWIHSGCTRGSRCAPGDMEEWKTDGRTVPVLGFFFFCGNQGHSRRGPRARTCAWRTTACWLRWRA